MILEIINIIYKNMETKIDQLLKKTLTEYEDIHDLCTLLHNNFESTYQSISEAINQEEHIEHNDLLPIGYISNHTSEWKHDYEYKRYVMNIYLIMNYLVRKENHIFFRYMSIKKLNQYEPIDPKFIHYFDSISKESFRSDFYHRYWPMTKGSSDIIIEYIEKNPIQVYQYLYNKRKDIFGYFAISLIKLCISDINSYILNKYKLLKSHIQYMPDGDKYEKTKEHFESLQ